MIMTPTTTTAPAMEVAFATVPMMGHMIPLLPFAAELLKRGHKVTFFHESSRKYRQKLEECGLLQNPNCRSVGYDCPNNHKWSDPIYDAVLQHYQHTPTKPNVVVYDFFAVDAADAADKMVVPAIGVFPNPQSINPWAASLQQQQSWKWNLWCAAGIPVLQSVLSNVLWSIRSYKRWKRNLPLLWSQDIYPSRKLPRHVISTYATGLEFAQAPQSPLLHRIGPSPSPSTKSDMDPELQAWLDKQNNKTTVYIAFGTMYKYSQKMVQRMEQELSKLGDDVAIVWSLPTQQQTWLSESATTHSNWKIDKFLPQQALLQSGRVKAFVTHCGSNSVSEAILSGVPMVCCPGSADQPANASRIAKAGVGIISGIEVGQKPSLAMAIQQILDPTSSFAENSAKLANSMDAEKNAEAAVDVILQATTL